MNYSKNSEGRRIKYDDDDDEIYTRLKSSSGPLNGLDNVDIFALALMYGKKNGVRTPLNKNAIGRIRKSTLDNSNIRLLMMAIAVEETGDMEVLVDEDKYFKISEEYAKAGLTFLNSEYVEKIDDILNDLEMEMIDFYDESNIKI